MLYFDQLTTITKHLSQIKSMESDNSTSPITCLDHSLSETNKYLLKMMHAARRKLRKLSNWSEWQYSNYKQLGQYHDQDTLGQHCQLPPGANVLDLLWTYNIKTDGTLKARCVCTGQPKFKGSVIFGYTYAKILDHVYSGV